MTDNYDQELEHSAMAEVPSTGANTSSPLKREKPALLLDTHSQTSVAETETSVESSPASALPMAVAHSSHSSSPITHLSDLQWDVHLAINSMFTTKRSSDLEMQWAIRDFEASLCQREAEVTAANEKAMVAHSGTHGAHVGIGSMCSDGGEQKPPRFLNSTPGSLTPGPANTQGWPPFFLLPSTGTIFVIPSIPHTHPSTSGWGVTTLHYSP